MGGSHSGKDIYSNDNFDNFSEKRFSQEMGTLEKIPVELSCGKYSVSIAKLNDDARDYFILNVINQEESQDKSRYIPRLVNFACPTVNYEKLQSLPYNDLVDIYQEIIHVNNDLRYETVFSELRKGYLSEDARAKIVKKKEEAQKEQKAEDLEETETIDIERLISELDFPALKEELGKEVISQDYALTHFLKPMIRVKHMGWPKNGIVSNYLFGGSGIGKTSSVRAASNILGIPLIYFQGSELRDRTAVNRLFGSSQGYVGYDDGGNLVNSLKEHPQAMLLFDEIGLVHRSVFESLRGFLDDGFVTDTNGNQFPMKGFVYFTSNEGNQLEDNSMGRTVGFQTGRDKSRENLESDRIKEILRQKGINEALLGRIDKFVPYAPLEKESLDMIFEKNVIDNNAKLKSFSLYPTQKARDAIISAGNPDKFGARNIIKNLDKLVEDVSMEFEFGENIEPGTEITVDFEDGSFQYLDGNTKIFEKSIGSFGF
ncbi:MAG: AAA family ATPase [Candidatus Woesearchaeota archaeon]